MTTTDKTAAFDAGISAMLRKLAFKTEAVSGLMREGVKFTKSMRHGIGPGKIREAAIAARKSKGLKVPGAAVRAPSDATKVTRRPPQMAA